MPVNISSTDEYVFLKETNETEIYSAGIDIIELSRFFKLIKRGPAVCDRLLNDSEKNLISNLNREPEKVEWTARFFAMKEAVMKSCGIGWQEGVSWMDIVLKKEIFTQSPCIRGELKRKTRQKIDRVIAVSAKHEELVVAYAVSLKK